jgi:multidrug efflux pump subunit AcrA (membrane-fusion protein)
VAIDTLCDMHAAALKAEQDAADREAQRAENARVAAELAAERQRLADEAAAVKAQALELQRKLEAQAKKEIDELDAQRAESDRLEALAVDRRRAEANAMAADAVGIVAAPGQYPAPALVASVAPASQAATPEGDKGPPMFLELGDIGAMLGFALHPSFVTLTLGIKPAANDDGAPLFNPSQWGDICDALLAHITDLKETQCQ